MILADNIDFVELDLEIQPPPRITPDPHAIRIKAGLEYLERDYILRTDKGWRVRFHGLTQPRWKHAFNRYLLPQSPINISLKALPRGFCIRSAGETERMLWKKTRWLLRTGNYT